ncbi:MAG: hypothetical protein IGBAC_0452 [Ignavibacteriae bacterium]|nr:MAG: hypothetical protein IGBAC_0452 [Ignavibacteriota bacterium]
MASAEISSLEPEIDFITNEQANKLNLRVKNGWILVTGFGTIGNIRIVDSIINDFAVANNVARIIPKENFTGFIAAFLSSNYGNKLLNDYAAGAVVKYIEAPQIAQIPIPILPDDIITETNDLYLAAVRCREDAHNLLIKARTLVLEYNNLPPLEEAEFETLDRDKEIDLRLVSTKEFTDDFRLDANYYNPVAETIIAKLKLSQNKIVYSGELNISAFTPKMFARNYVDALNGIPFLSGKNLIQIRPTGLKYISKTETNDVSNLLVYKDYILVTRAGTVGRTIYIYHNYENFAVSDNVLRIIPNSGSIDPGYYYAFLSSDYGFYQIDRFKHGSVIDVIDDDYLNSLLIPIPEKDQQKEIGDLVRQAYDLRAEAIRLEDEAQEILTKALTGK